MKIRIGFVSNSRSASFCIPMYKLTENQFNRIKNHFSYAKEQVARYKRMIKKTGKGKNSDKFHSFKCSLGLPLFCCKVRDMWEIFTYDGYLCGGTNMTNFEMGCFLSAIGVPRDCVYWFDTCGYGSEYLIKHDFPIYKAKVKIQEDQSKLEELKNKVASK